MKWRAIGGLVTVFLYMPIWYYLMYQILVRVNASELMWFLFLVYVPMGLFVSAITSPTRERS